MHELLLRLGELVEPNELLLPLSFSTNLGLGLQSMAGSTMCKY